VAPAVDVDAVELIGPERMRVGDMNRSLFFALAITLSFQGLASFAHAQAQAVNLALGKPATQSSDIDKVNGKASLAVDGNTDGTWTNGSVTHTVDGGSENPWWQVDLGATYTIQKVLIWNRTDCCAERLGSLRVLIGSGPHGPWNWFSQEGSLFFSDGARVMSMSGSISGRKDGRYIRIQLLGPKAILSLAEVQVMGVPVAPPVVQPVINVEYEQNLGTNIAEGKTATQSSDADPVNGLASKAVDGNTDGDWAHGSVTHTVNKGSSFPWWQVDLGSEYRVTAIQLFNRTDCCSERLNEIRVVVGSDLNAMSIFGGASAPYYYNRQNPVTFKGDATGRFVRIILQGGDKAILSLAEVKVFGELVPEAIAVVPEPQQNPPPAPTPCVTPGIERPGYVWDPGNCGWVPASRPPSPQPQPQPEPIIPTTPATPTTPPPTIAPFIRSPHDNTPFNIMPRKVVISWDAVAGGIRNYTVEVEVLAGGNWRLWDSQRVSALSLEPTMDGDGTYRFRVAGTGSDGAPGAFSAWHSFTFNTAGPPAPSVRSPVNGYEWTCGPIPGCGRAVFLWNAADRADRYIVVVEAYQNGAWRPFAAQSTTALQLEMNFPTDTPGRWSVQSVGNGVLGGTSMVNTFKVHWKL